MRRGCRAGDQRFNTAETRCTSLPVPGLGLLFTDEIIATRRQRIVILPSLRYIPTHHQNGIGLFPAKSSALTGNMSSHPIRTFSEMTFGNNEDWV